MLFLKSFLCVAAFLQYWVLLITMVLHMGRKESKASHDRIFANYHEAMDAAMASGNYDGYEVVYRSFRHYYAKFA